MMLGNTNRTFSFRVKSIKISVTDSIDLLGVNVDKNKKMILDFHIFKGVPS